MSEDSLLRVMNVSKRFGGVQALREVSIRVARGEIHGLVGPNGSGKSTLLGVIGGTVRPDTGTVSLADQEHALGFSSPLAARAAGVELMPQELVLVPTLSVRDNVILGAEPRRRAGRLDKTAATDQAARALEAIGLDIPLGLPGAALAPAEQRMLMLARTLHRTARLVVVDEPTAGLQPSAARKVRDAVRRVRDAGTAVIFVSHYLGEVAELVDEVTALRDGEVVAELGRGQVTRDAMVDVLMQGRAAPRRVAENRRASRGRLVLDAHRVTVGAVRNADLTAHAGEIVGLAGLLGSGRDELTGALVGVRPPTAGDVVIDGVAVRTPVMALRAGVGHLSGDRSACVIPTMTINEHVTLPHLERYAELRLLRARALRDAAGEALAAVGIAGGGRYLHELSGGNQQRALMARWFVDRRTLLVAHEPTVGVDVAARRDLLHEIAAYGEDAAVVLSSSEPEELAEICHRVLCMRHGSFAAELQGDEINAGQIIAAIS